MELQEQERLLKLQKLNETGVSLADFASEIAENKSLNTSEAEQVQEETVDLQPDEQVTHYCSTQTEAFDHNRSVASLSVKDCPCTDVSTQTEEFDYLFTHLLMSKPFDQNYFRDDNAKVSFYTGLSTYEVLEATFIHVSPFVKRRTQCLMSIPVNSVKDICTLAIHYVQYVRLPPLIRWPERRTI